MFFILSKILYFLILPFTWVIVALLVSVLTSNPRHKRLLRTVGLLILVVFSNPWLSHVALGKLESAPSGEVKPHTIGIVLTGMVESGIGVNHQVQLNESADRLLAAVQLYHSGKIKKILISGGSADILYPNENEGKALHELALGLGVPSSDLIPEQQSRNTYENALYVSDLMQRDTGSLLLITSAFHMPRARRCFEKQNLNVTPYPVDYRVPSAFRMAHLLPAVSAFHNWNIVIKECLGLIVYRLKGYI